MTAIQADSEVGKRKRVVAGAALAGAMAIGALALNVSSAGAAPQNRELATPVASVAATQTATAKPMEVPNKVIRVAVNDAQLRSAPTTAHNNVIGSANAGTNFTTDCWTQENFAGSGYIWFHGTVWGGGTGYMRVDMFTDDATGNPVIRRC